jgi:hypothetical protein
MPGPAPTYQPTFTPEQLADCERLVRQHSAVLATQLIRRMNTGKTPR